MTTDQSSIETLIRESLERVCASEIPKFQKPAYHNTVPRELFSALAAVGVAGLSIPEEFGGINANARTSATVMETLARFDMGPAIFISVHSMVAGLISRFGSDAQKTSLLPKMADGSLLGAFALTEPQAGSDASALTSEARRTSDGFVLKGSKCYITSAGFADNYVVFAKTDMGDKPEISAFVVPKDSPGMTVGAPEHKMGCELSPIASIFFDDVVLPDSALLGPLHGGYKVALSGLAGGRVNIAACANGIASAALSAALRFGNERKQFGREILEFQGLQFMLADMYCKLEAARQLTRKAAEEIDLHNRGNTANINVKLSSSVAKCVATDAAMAITTDAVQVLGGAGYIKEYGVERLMRDAKMLQIVEGTNQIQRMLIARELRTSTP